MPYRPGLHLQGRRRHAVRSGRFPGRLRSRARACSTTRSWRARQARAARGRPAHRHRPRVLPPGLRARAVRGRQRARRSRAGKVYVYIGVAAQGQGHATTLAQIAARELGVPLDDVTVVARRHRAVSLRHGRAAAAAWRPMPVPPCAHRRAEVRRRAARWWPPSAGVRARGHSHRGRARPRGRRALEAVALGRAGPRGRQGQALLRAAGEPGLNACTYFSPETVTWAFGTQAAVVEVDVETCAVRAAPLRRRPRSAVAPSIR